MHSKFRENLCPPATRGSPPNPTGYLARKATTNFLLEIKIKPICYLPYKEILLRKKLANCTRNLC